MKAISIRIWLAVVFLLLAVAPLIGATAFFLHIYEDTLRETVIGNLARIADRKADQIGNYLDERATDLNFLSRSPAVVDALTVLATGPGGASASRPLDNATRERLQSIVEKASHYGLLLIDTAGNIVYAIGEEAETGSNLLTGRLRDTRLAEGFRRTLRFLQSGLTHFEHYPPSDKRVASFLVAPVLKDGAPIGALALQISIDRLEPVLSDRTGLGTTGDTVLAQLDSGQVLYPAPHRHAEEDAFRPTLPFAEVAAPMRAALTGEAGEGVTLDQRNTEVAAAWRYLPALGCGMVVRMDRDEAFAPLGRMKRLTVTALTTVLPLISLLAWYFGVALTGRLRRLTLMAEGVGRGDRNLWADETGPAELRQLAAAFNQMNDSLTRLHSGLEAQIEERTRDLRKSEENLRRILDEAPLSIAVAGPHGEVTFRNRRFREVIGYDEAEVPELSRWWPLAYPDPAYRERVLARREDVRQEAARQGGALRPVEVSIACRDGRTRVLDVHASHIGKQDVIMFVDLTEQRLIEAQLKDSLSFTETILSESPIAMAVFRTDGPCVMANGALARLVGGTVENLLQQNFRDLASWRDGRILEIALEALEQRQTCCEQVDMVSTFGKEMRMNVQFVPITLNGEPHLLGQFLDMTDIHRAADAMRAAKNLAEAANQAKSAFLANMSHEIRTPLNAVIGLSQLLTETPLDSRQKDYVTKILSSSKALLAILNDILDHSKIEAGRIELETVPFDLDEVLEGVARLFAAPAEDKDIELFFDIAPDVPTALRGDPLRLGQVLNNLVGNAVKFTERGEILLSVAIEPPEERREEKNGEGEEEHRVVLRFAVTDTGGGIPEEQAARLFQPFTQADGSITRKFGGTGLGLAIAKRLTELMGGTIGVETHPGEGSCFHFTARLETAPDGSHAPVPRHLAGARVLVVDGRASGLRIITGILASWGAKPLAAGTGAAALAALDTENARRDPFDLILAALVLPDMSGPEFIAEAERRADAAGRITPPVIAMATGLRPQEPAGPAPGPRIHAVVPKPATSKALLDAVQGLYRPAIPHPSLPGYPADSLWGRMAPIRGASVLLAEDNPINQLVAREFLEKAGLQVAVAQNGREAVALAARNIYDLILMDLHMPEMDGLEATRLILAAAGKNAPPVIALTAAAMRQDKDAAYAAGMSDHVAKPIEPELLATTLLKWIRWGRHGGAFSLPEGEAQEWCASDESDGNGAGAAMEEMMEDKSCFDFGDLARRLGGNEALIPVLLKSFIGTFANTGQEMAGLIRTGDLAGAARLCHALTGAAGNLGANTLHHAAMELERELKNGAFTSLPRFEAAIAGTLEAASSRIQSDS